MYIINYGSIEVFWRRYVFPTSRLNGMMYGNEIYTRQLFWMPFSCYNSRNHNLCIKKNDSYNPSEIIISIFSGYFVKSNTKFKMCLHMIVFYSHTGSTRGGRTCYVVRFIQKKSIIKRTILIDRYTQMAREERWCRL